MTSGTQTGTALACIAAIIGIAQPNHPAMASEEVIFRELPWQTICKLDEATHEKNCSIWRLLTHAKLRTDNSSTRAPVLVVNAIDNYSFVQSAPHSPTKIRIDNNSPFVLDQCLEPTLCFVADASVADLRRQLETGDEMVVTFIDANGASKEVEFDLSGYREAHSVAMRWLQSQP